AGEGPRELEADVRGADWLELAVGTTCWDFCHAVWLDPLVEEGEAVPHGGTLTDCLGRTEVALPALPLVAQRCVATVVSAGFAPLLDDLLGSLAANGACPDVPAVVFVVGPDPEAPRVVARPGAVPVACAARGAADATAQ